MGTIKFHDVPQFAAGSFTQDDNSLWTENAINSKIINTPVNTIDNFVKENNISKIDFIKIDVEGSELNVLNGAIKSLVKFKPIVIFEVSSWTLNAFRKIIPEILVRRAMELFDDIYVIDRNDGHLESLSTEKDIYYFLHNNITNGNVDNILGCFRDDFCIKTIHNNGQYAVIQERDMVYKSRSWKITAPLRAIKRFFTKK